MLDELAYTILKAYKFDSDHLWQFVYTDRYGRGKHVYHSFWECTLSSILILGIIGSLMFFVYKLTPQGEEV
ncbi:MAG: hypothetical protein Fur0022_27630 [Anaerolineales bacterium]